MTFAPSTFFQMTTREHALIMWADYANKAKWHAMEAIIEEGKGNRSLWHLGQARELARHARSYLTIARASAKEAAV